MIYHLPYDMPRCTGELSDDPALVWRPDCRTCLRRLAPELQPQPCDYHLPTTA